MRFIINFSSAASEKSHFLREDGGTFMNKSIGEARKLMSAQKPSEREQQSAANKNACR